MQRSQPKPSEQSTETPPAWESRLWTAGLILLVTVVYLPTLNNGFVCDDDAAVENNFALTVHFSGLFNIPVLSPMPTIGKEPLTLNAIVLGRVSSGGVSRPRGYPHREPVAACHVCGADLAAACKARGSRRIARRGDLRRASGHGRKRCLDQRAAERAVLCSGTRFQHKLAYCSLLSPEIPKPSKARLPARGDNRRYCCWPFVLYLAAALEQCSHSPAMAGRAARDLRLETRPRDVHVTWSPWSFFLLSAWRWRA